MRKPIDLPDSQTTAVRLVSPSGMRGWRYLIFLTLFLRPGLQALAQETPATPANPTSQTEHETFLVYESLHEEGLQRPFSGSVSVLFDNDCFTANDNRYTAGFSLAWTSAPTERYGRKNIHRRIITALSFLPTVNSTDYCNYLQLTLGMEIYTAGDISIPDPPHHEHPYAGILHLDCSVISMNRISCNQFTLRLGWVGPTSSADEVQKWVHKMIGSPIPQGWDAQLSDEPVVNLFYQYGRRLAKRSLSDLVSCDLTAKGGGGLGNYYMGANIGFMARVGLRLPDTYGITPIIGEAQSIAGLEPAGETVFSYLFLETQGFAVLRWLPMDGNTISESRSIDRNFWAANVSIGLALGFNRVVLTYAYHGITGLTGLESVPSTSQDSFGTLILTVFVN